MRLLCDDIALAYAGAEAPVFAALNFSLEGPGFHALFGPSGVGKTSLARILIEQVRPDAGQIRAEGCRRCLYSYNLERLPGWSSVGRHLKKVAPPERRSQCEALAVDFGLEGLMGQRFSQLSLGQKNRVNLIRYLVQEYDLLIMDESLANVDERTREHIILKIKALFPQRFFLYISHNVVEVARFCRQVLVLRDARRQPQAAVVCGRDQQPQVPVAPAALEQAMLAIMNAG
jgi:ABC-type multidrug transport system ATPase subunit